MKHFDDMIRQSLNESVEHKDTSVTFDQIVTQNRKTKVKKKKWINKMNVGIGSIVALLLIVLISISFIHPHTLDQSGQTRSKNTAKTQSSTESQNNKLARAFLKKMKYSILSYDGEKAYTLTSDLLSKQETLNIELQTMGAYPYKNTFRFAGKNIINNTITIERYTISGHWREKFINTNKTKVGVVLINNKAVGGFTIPGQGKSNEEGIWSLFGPQYNEVVVAGNSMTQQAIVKELYRQILEKRKTIQPTYEQISQYKIQNVKILNSHAFHGFDFYISYDVNPKNKKNYPLAGGNVRKLKDGWIRIVNTGKIIEIKKGTYMLEGAGDGGPFGDIKLGK